MIPSGVSDFVTQKVLTKKNLELAVSCVLGIGAGVANWYNQRMAIKSVGEAVAKEITKQQEPVKEKEPEPEKESKGGEV